MRPGRLARRRQKIRRGEEAVDGRAPEIAQVIEVGQQRLGDAVQEVGTVGLIAGHQHFHLADPSSSEPIPPLLRQRRALGGRVGARVAREHEVGDRQPAVAGARPGNRRRSPRYRGRR